MKIFLGDLVHTWEKVSVWTMPLNIGFIGAYAQENLPFDCEIRLFKRPELMLEAIKTERPDVVGLSYYVWNVNLNNRVLRSVREHAPGALTVGGGPVFTNINSNEETARKFFTQHAECDAYVLNQGEVPFTKLVEKFDAVGRSREALTSETMDGAILNDLAHNDCCRIGQPLELIRDLDVIPSPYLNGMLDEFFEEPITPLIETNRSCPYRCTFCAWGIGTGKLARFSDERVLAEIDYISERCTKTANMYIADANYSILERDALFAERMRDNSEKHGFPAHVMVQWNKTRPDRVLRVAEVFGDLTEVGASMQSLNEDVLDAIQRRNLSLDDIANMREQLKTQTDTGQMFSELIVGLPEETWQSHVDANKTLIDMDAEVFNYNLHLLPGTEMDTPASRETYFKRTGWRLHDNAFGVYDGERVFEGQEVVLETTSMSMDELRSFRFIHFLLQFMWGRKWYFDLLMLLRQDGIHPVDVILAVDRAFKSDQGELGDLYAEFRADHDLENFETFEDLAAYWSEDEHFERLRQGKYGKLNYLFTFKVLLEHHTAFNAMLSDVCQDLVGALDLSAGDKETRIQQCEDILRFSEFLRIQLTENLSLVEKRSAHFNYDILAWRSSGSQQPLEPGECEYEFFLPEKQRDMLLRQLDQFHVGNVNAALRKMSEDTSAEQFFYQVRTLNNPSYVR